MTEIQKVRNDLKLSEKRMRHTEGVVRAAVLLASRHFPEISAETAELAALFHDYTKEYKVEEQLRVLATYGEAPTDEELRAPKLLHSRTAALIAEKEYGLDHEVVSAIRWHTTGRAGDYHQPAVWRVPRATAPRTPQELEEDVATMAGTLPDTQQLPHQTATDTIEPCRQAEGRYAAHEDAARDVRPAAGYMSPLRQAFRA